MAEQPGTARAGRPPRRGISDEELERLRRQPAQPLTVNQAAGAQLLYQGRALLIGYQLRNSGAAADSANLFDGSSAANQSLGRIEIPAGDSRGTGLSAEGILCNQGITVVQGAGTIDGAVFAKF